MRFSSIRLPETHPPISVLAGVNDSDGMNLANGPSGWMAHTRFSPDFLSVKSVDSNPSDPLFVILSPAAKLPGHSSVVPAQRDLAGSLQL
jgi:hypothetical protein